MTFGATLALMVSGVRGRRQGQVIRHPLPLPRPLLLLLLLLLLRRLLLLLRLLPWTCREESKGTVRGGILHAVLGQRGREHGGGGRTGKAAPMTQAKRRREGRGRARERHCRAIKVEARRLIHLGGHVSCGLWTKATNATWTLFEKHCLRPPHPYNRLRRRPPPPTPPLPPHPRPPRPR